MIHMLRIDRKGIRSSERFILHQLVGWQTRSRLDCRVDQHEAEWERHLDGIHVQDLCWMEDSRDFYLFVYAFILFVAKEIQWALRTWTCWPSGWGASHDLLPLQPAYALFWPLKIKQCLGCPPINWPQSTALFTFFIQIILYIGSIVTWKKISTKLWQN